MPALSRIAEPIGHAVHRGGNAPSGIQRGERPHQPGLDIGSAHVGRAGSRCAARAPLAPHPARQRLIDRKRDRDRPHRSARREASGRPDRARCPHPCGCSSATTACPSLPRSPVGSASCWAWMSVALRAHTRRTTTILGNSRSSCGRSSVRSAGGAAPSNSLVITQSDIYRLNPPCRSRAGFAMNGRGVGTGCTRRSTSATANQKRSARRWFRAASSSGVPRSPGDASITTVSRMAWAGWTLASSLTSPLVGGWLAGGRGRIRTSVGYAGDFTDRSLWPLGHPPAT